MKPACTLLLLTLLSSPFVVSAQENIEKTFTFGIVSNKAQSKIKKATPLTQYVTENMAEYGYAKGAVKVFKNYRQLAVSLENGTVQIVRNITMVYSYSILREHANVKAQTCKA